MAQVSYPFAVGRIRVLETRLLDSGKWVRLREASREDAARLLAESGYGGGKPGAKAEPEQLIRAETEETHRVIAELSPEPAWTDLFLLPTDAHNIKAIYKGKVLGQDVSRLLVDGGTISPELLRICIENGEYSMLPPAFGAVLEKEYPDLLRFSAAVDRAVFEHIRQVLKKKKNPLLSRYFEAQVDFTNVVSTLRAVRLHWDGEKLETVLLPGGTIPAETFPAALTVPAEGLSAALAKGENASAIDRVLGDYLQSGDITQAEQRFTEERIALLKNGDDSAFSIGPIVCYLMQRETEARQLRVLFAEKM